MLDTPPEPAFDDLTWLVAHVCQTPVALVTFIDARRQWFKSEVGLGLRETPLDASFCVHFVEQHGVIVVPDAAADERFRNNPLVNGAPHVRFYAEAPLDSADGHRLGALCVLDYRPRDLTDAQRQALLALARQVPLVFVDTNLFLDFYRARNEVGSTLLNHLPLIQKHNGL